MMIILSTRVLKYWGHYEKRNLEMQKYRKMVIMSETKIEYKIETFPLSEVFMIFCVFNDNLWQVNSPRAYYIDDTQKWDYFHLVFDDMITAEIICDILNEEKR